MSSNVNVSPHAGTQEWLIDGVRPERVARPESVADVSAILREAAERDAPVVPIGGGTALSIGNMPACVDIALELGGLSGVRDYQPFDLTASVSAGTTIADLAATLAEHGQELPLDIPFPDRATIGGLVATGFAGPRRLGYGTLKELLIGCSYVRGDGLVAKAGGMVVKNVSGFEIPRLLHGSWGALAVITSVNLKVTPRPKAEATLIGPVNDVPSAIPIAQRLIQSEPALAACEVFKRDGRSCLAIRVMGRLASVQAQLQAIPGRIGGDITDIETLEADESRVFWQRYVDDSAGTDDEVQVVAGTRPRETGTVFDLISRRLGDEKALSRVAVSPGLGTIRLSFAPEAVSATGWSAIASGDLPAGTSLTVERAPVAWKEGLNVWGPKPDGYAVMQAIKREFDPAGVLNRGRVMVQIDD